MWLAQENIVNTVILRLHLFYNINIKILKWLLQIAMENNQLSGKKLFLVVSVDLTYKSQAIRLDKSKVG